MSVLKNFKTTPRSPYGGATGPRCNFFSSNLQRGPWPKKMKGACRPPSGDRWPPPTGATGGPVAPPSGDRAMPPYISIRLPFPPHLSSKISPKIQKKERGEEKKSGEALPDSALVICRLVHLVYVFFHWYCRVI